MSKAKDLIELCEMARIGVFGKFEIRIYPEPLGNPSFHLIKQDEYEVVLRIKDFEVLEWKFNKRNLKRVSGADMKEVTQYLHQRHELGVTNWQFLVATWNSNNPKYQLPLPK